MKVPKVDVLVLRARRFIEHPKVQKIAEVVRTNRRLQRWLVNAGLLILIYSVVQFLVSWFAQPKLVEIMTMSPLAGRVAVSTVPVQRGEISSVVTYTGSVEPYFSAEIRSRIQGWVQDVLVDENTYVKKGQLMIRLDHREVGGQRDQAQADYLFWESELKRMEFLHKEKAVSDFDWDNTKKQYEAARARYEAASAMYSYAEITAPFDGWIDRRFVDPGDLVNPGSTLLRVVDYHRVRVQAKVAGADAEYIKAGSEVVVQFPALSNPKNGVKSKVTTVFPGLDPVTRTSTVEIVVDNPQRVIKPEMYAVVSLVLERRQGALMVPRVSVLDLQGKPTLFVTDGVSAKARTVRVGISDGERVEILEGLEEGESVVYKGNRGLVDGQHVNVVQF